MNKRAGSLTFPSNPLAAMQELSALDSPAPAEVISTEVVQEEPIAKAIKQTDPSDNKSYDSMTNKLSGNQSTKKTGSPVRQKAAQTESKLEGQPIGQSVAQLIRQRAGKEADKEVLKTVTLKISPSLDERIERYCFENKIKKQDFWAEAAALYFETVETAE